MPITPPPGVTYTPVPAPEGEPLIVIERKQLVTSLTAMLPLDPTAMHIAFAGPHWLTDAVMWAVLDYTLTPAEITHLTVVRAPNYTLAVHADIAMFKMMLTTWYDPTTIIERNQVPWCTGSRLTTGFYNADMSVGEYANLVFSHLVEHSFHQIVTHDDVVNDILKVAADNPRA